jgi:hypothetical protein
MSSVLSSFRQKSQTGKYLLVTGTPVAGAAYTVSSIPTTVAITNATGIAAGAEAMVDASGGAGTPFTLSAGALLLDLGREAVIYSETASITGVTSPYYKLAIYRQVALGTAGAGNEGAPGPNAATYWVKVWSATGTNVIVNRL